ncbi:MAG: hypothetical protein U9Q20_00605 [Campylobacterota bacterium]|nr:hypothetical protein [Campylobacterota bacterium]
MTKNPTFQNNGFIFKTISFDEKKMILTANKFDNQNNFIKVVQLRMGEIPKNIKKKLNPLK